MKRILQIFLAFTLILISCKPKFLDIYSIGIVSYYNKDSLLNECKLADLIKVDNYYIFIHLDSDCSVCLFELSWWDKFLENHKKLTPIFIIKSTNHSSFLLYSKESVFQKYLFTFDNDHLFSRINKLDHSIPSVITDGSFRILYKGDPIEKKRFDKIYRNL
jgi:hypothetical protein